MGLSTHILDTHLGKPAAGIEVLLSKDRGGDWRPVARGTTDADGRCKSLLNEPDFEATTYKLTFHTGKYFRDRDLQTLYPWVDIVFTVTDPSTHHHIPLLLTANGYTTYRGS